MTDGYHWFRHNEGTVFIALLEDGLWYLPGIEHPVKLDESEVICAAVKPQN